MKLNITRTSKITILSIQGERIRTIRAISGRSKKRMRKWREKCLKRVTKLHFLNT